MNKLSGIVLLLAFIFSACAPTATPQPAAIPATAAPTVTPANPINEISFADLEPKGFHEGWSWNALGVDKAGQVYMAIGYGDVGKPNDVGVFRYSIGSGERKFLTTLKTVSQAENNLLPGENLIKGHTRIVEMNGKVYIGSQGFHDIFEINPTVRGGHLYQMDVATEQWHDLSVTDPDGVSIPNQGVIAVDVIPEKNLVVGYTSPAGAIIVYDLAAGRSTVYTNPDAAQYLGRNVARHIVYSSKYNRVYTSFAGSPMMRLDLNSGAYTSLPASSGEFYFGPGPGFDYGNEFVTAMAKNQDGSQVYFLSWNGDLYHFDADNETLTQLGQVSTSDELAKNIKVGTAFALVMSADEKYVYTIPSSMSDGSIGLYRYDIAAGVWSKLIDLTQKAKGGVFAGGEIDFQGCIYFAHFGDEGGGWVHLMQIDVNNLKP